jgi:hypothetical protein
LSTAERDAQLEWERSTGRLAAAAAIATVVLIIASQVVRAAVLTGDLDTDREQLTSIDDAGSGLLGSSALQALSQLTLAFALFYLYRVAKFRRPELPGFVLPLIVVSPLLLVAGRIITDVNLLDIADDFVSSGATEGRAGEQRAEDLIEDRALIGPGVLQAGVLALGLSLVLLSLNAMRAGVLSRFMGVLGIIIGVLYVIPLFGGPSFIQVFWAGALAALFLNRWPNGRGPAWASGEPDPWPTAAQLRAEAVEAQLEERAGAEPGETADEPVRPASRKRKRRR